MPRLDSSSKFGKVLRFLLTANDPRVFALLGLRGFNNATRREGWDLFYRAGGRHVDMQTPPHEGLNFADLLGALDAYENEWYDVIDACVGRAFAELHQALMMNLHKSSGPEVVFTVKTILDRVDALEKEDAMKAVLALLASRGFTPEVRARGRELIKQVSEGEVASLPTPDPVAETERVKAEEEMWQWYLDWSKTARTVVRRKDLRIRLGVSSPVHHGAEDAGPSPSPLPPAEPGDATASPASPAGN
jgi:hypothetical protein